jgi:hypothetical protein
MQLLQIIANEHDIEIVNFQEFSQPNFPVVTSSSRRSLVKWREAQRRYELQWNSYLTGGGGGRARTLRKLISYSGQLIFKLNTRRSSVLKSEGHARAIETFVTNKHMNGVRRAHELKMDGLIILEVDACSNENSREGLSAIMSKLKYEVTTPLYVNIAGGLQPDQLGIQRLGHKYENEPFVNYLKPVTNTSCSYLLNRKFIAAFIEWVISNPDKQALGIDWVFNCFFMDSKFEIKSLHSDPPALTHGSFSGITQSWNPKNQPSSRR